MDISFLERLFDEVVKIAKEDDVVTADERAILEKTRQHIDQFKILFEKATKTDALSAEETKVLDEAYKKIYSESQAEALKDDVLTKDEVKIISKIAHSLFTP